MTWPHSRLMRLALQMESLSCGMAMTVSREWDEDVVPAVVVAAVDFVVALTMMMRRMEKRVKMVHYGLHSCSGYFGCYCDAAGHQPVSDYWADDCPVVPDPHLRG